jgi:hypothetical protein
VLSVAKRGCEEPIIPKTAIKLDEASKTLLVQQTFLD